VSGNGRGQRLGRAGRQGVRNVGGKACHARVPGIHGQKTRIRAAQGAKRKPLRFDHGLIDDLIDTHAGSSSGAAGPDEPA